MANQKIYTPEFRDYVTKLVVLDGRKQTDISRELNIPYDTLQKWVSRYRKIQRDEELARQNHLLSASEYREMYEAERLKRLEMEEENTILKKAMHIFTQGKK
jgi:transposase